MQDNKPKLIFINGPVAAGKSTLAQRYIDDHKFALLLSADHFVGSMGQWLKNEDEAKELALEYVLLVAERHLKAGYDVVMPFLLANPKNIEKIERIADQSGARLCEFSLIVPRDEAIAWAIERGTWGEPTSPPLVEEDRPIVEELYDRFSEVLKTRQKSVPITIKRGDIEGTYQDLLTKVHLKGDVV